MASTTYAARYFDVLGGRRHAETPLSAVVAEAAYSLVRATAQWAAEIAQRRREREAEARLLRMSAHLLRDIGIENREDIPRFVRKGH